MKTCLDCNLPKPDSEFYVCAQTGKLHTYCKKCCYLRAKRWRKINPDKVKKAQKKCNNSPKTKKRRQAWITANKDRYRNAITRSSAKVRREVLLHYCNGRLRCQCPGCTETRYEFLTIDHVDGKGSLHRRSEKITKIYRWLKNHAFPLGFQVLCYNCNCAKRTDKTCPHCKSECWSYEI